MQENPFLCPLNSGQQQENWTNTTAGWRPDRRNAPQWRDALYQAWLTAFRPFSSPSHTMNRLTEKARKRAW